MLGFDMKIYHSFAQNELWLAHKTNHKPISAKTLVSQTRSMFTMPVLATVAA